MPRGTRLHRRQPQHHGQRDAAGWPYRHPREHAKPDINLLVTHSAHLLGYADRDRIISCNKVAIARLRSHRGLVKIRTHCLQRQKLIARGRQSRLAYSLRLGRPTQSGRW